MTVDDVEQAIGRLNRMLASHAGSVRLLSSEAGVVRVAFEDMCAGCPCRAMTLSATVEPELMRVEGVTEVRARGVNISAAARRRLRTVRRAAW